MHLDGSKTRENLNNAFNAEARANALYRLWADIARQAGDYVTGQLFEKTARNELAHAKVWYDLLNSVEPGTTQTLRLALDSERFEWTQMYADYAATARAEGFEDIARLFEGVGATEQTHETAFSDRLTALLDGSAHCAARPVDWICQSCGHHQQGTTAPEVCPVCRHGQGYFLTTEK